MNRLNHFSSDHKFKALQAESCDFGHEHVFFFNVVEFGLLILTKLLMCIIIAVVFLVEA